MTENINFVGSILKRTTYSIHKVKDTYIYTEYQKRNAPLVNTVTMNINIFIQTPKSLQFTNHNTILQADNSSFFSS
jgi:hypothetical protein